MMKTATIENSLILGASNGVFFTVQYRGKVLYSLNGHRADSADLLAKCVTWAKNQGFTHIKQRNA